MSNAAAAWHPDPSGRHQLRYWDGGGWTTFVSDNGVTTSDPLGPPPQEHRTDADPGPEPRGHEAGPDIAAGAQAEAVGDHASAGATDADLPAEGHAPAGTVAVHGPATSAPPPSVFVLPALLVRRRIDAGDAPVRYDVADASGLPVARIVETSGVVGDDRVRPSWAAVTTGGTDFALVTLAGHPLACFERRAGQVMVTDPEGAAVATVTTGGDTLDLQITAGAPGTLAAPHGSGRRRTVLDGSGTALATITRTGDGGGATTVDHSVVFTRSLPVPLRLMVLAAVLALSAESAPVAAHR